MLEGAVIGEVGFVVMGEGSTAVTVVSFLLFSFCLFLVFGFFWGLKLGVRHRWFAC